MRIDHTWVRTWRLKSGSPVLEHVMFLPKRRNEKGHFEVSTYPEVMFATSFDGFYKNMDYKFYWYLLGLEKDAVLLEHLSLSTFEGVSYANVAWREGDHTSHHSFRVDSLGLKIVMRITS